MSDPDSMAAAEYVLGTLDLAERRAFERRIAADPLLRAQVAQWRAELDPILDAIEPVEPPPAAWDRIDAALDEMTRGQIVAPLSRSAFRPSIRRPRVAAAMFGALAASIVALAFAPSFNHSNTGAAPPSLPPIASPANPQTQSVSASAVPCANDGNRAIQSAKTHATQRETPSPSVSVASGVGGQGSVVVGGSAVTGGGQQPGKPEGPVGIAVASAANPSESGDVTPAPPAYPGCR